MGEGGFPGQGNVHRGVITEGRQQLFGGQTPMTPPSVLQEQYIQHLEAGLVAREAHVLALSAMLLRQAETIANLTAQEEEEPEKRRGTL